MSNLYNHVERLGSLAPFVQKITSHGQIFLKLVDKDGDLIEILDKDRNGNLFTMQSLADEIFMVQKNRGVATFEIINTETGQMLHAQSPIQGKKPRFTSTNVYEVFSALDGIDVVVEDKFPPLTQASYLDLANCIYMFLVDYIQGDLVLEEGPITSGEGYDNALNLGFSDIVVEDGYLCVTHILQAFSADIKFVGNVAQTYVGSDKFKGEFRFPTIVAQV